MRILILNVNESHINFYLILGIILIIIIILNVYNFRNQSIDLNKDPIELIKETHNICPVMNNETKIISCVRFSPLNEGFIISVCCVVVLMKFNHHLIVMMVNILLEKKMV